MENAKRHSSQQAWRYRDEQPAIYHAPKGEYSKHERDD
jgi:hypothetical protein